MDRCIIHCDMNAFFASVEQSANPKLRGKPVGVVGCGGRTIITTASYEARAFGVKTGMAIWEAKRCCPELIVVVGDNKKYTYTSSRINQIYQNYTPLVEPFSIDESFLDLTGSIKLFGSAENIAHQIKGRIKSEFGITCSIGIAPNKLLAKLASDIKKPDGLTVIMQDDVKYVMETLPVKELCGIGKRTEQSLKLMSIYTCGELGRCDESRLVRKFGVIGHKLKQMGLGVDDSQVIPFGEVDEVKSIGHSMTLERDIDDPHEIRRVLLQLSEMVGRRARRHGVTGKTVSIFVRYADYFSSFSKQTTLNGYVSLSDEIYKAALSILDTVKLEQSIRLMGVSLSNLDHHAQQLPLLEEERRKVFACKAMDEVNEKFGEMAVTFGSLLPEKENSGSFVISPAWRPNGIRSVDVK